MKFTQSRFQDFFSRCYTAVCYLGYAILFNLVGMILGFGFDVGFELLLYGALALIPIIYIRFAYEAGSKTIELIDGVLFFRSRSMVTDIAQKDFEGYQVTKLPPHTVVLHDKVYGKTEFSYYAFSASQRKQIFHMLDEFQGAK